MFLELESQQVYTRDHFCKTAKLNFGEIIEGILFGNHVASVTPLSFFRMISMGNAFSLRIFKRFTNIFAKDWRLLGATQTIFFKRVYCLSNVSVLRDGDFIRGDCNLVS